MQRFEEKQVRYVRYLPDKSNGEYMNWQHVYQTNDRKVGIVEVKASICLGGRVSFNYVTKDTKN